jgi:hypothetical protein
MICKFNTRLGKVKICTVVCLPLSTYLQFSIAWHQWHLISHREKRKFQSCKAISPSVNSNRGGDFFVNVVICCFLIICITITCLNNWHFFDKCDASGSFVLQGLWNNTRQNLKQFIFLTTNVVTCCMFSSG